MSTQPKQTKQSKQLKELKKAIYPLPRTLFLKRFFYNILFGLIIISLALFMGMLGYRSFENMSWTDAYLNASMILSGMGPVSNLQTQAGKLFAGSYAIFSGTLFLITIAIVFAPIIHRFFHQFHLEEDDDPK